MSREGVCLGASHKFSSRVHAGDREADDSEVESTDRMKKRRCWKTNRCTCTICVIVVIAILLTLAVTFFLPAVRGRRDAVSPLKWWQTAIVYQVYPRSFQDQDGDGTGDLRGILRRMPYLRELQVGAIWLSPFYRSPMRDFGYDVSNYTDVDPIFGDMTDFEQLVETAHKNGLRVIIDFVPNHTSNESMWFQSSRGATDNNKYKDYYIWHPGKTGADGSRIPPNNWRSGFGGSAWQWDGLREQYYYHHYLTSQPDLNYRNPEVQGEIENVLRFWLDKGVDGFRLDAISWLYETDAMQDEETYSEFTRNQPEIYSTIKRWKKIIDEYDRKENRDRVLIAEGPDEMTREMWKSYTDAGAQPFFFKLTKAKHLCGATAKCFASLLKEAVDIADGQWPNFVIGNHDNPRVADRLGPDFTDAMNVLLLTLPGTPTTYYGEELGMRGGNYTGLPPRDTKANQSNNTSRSRDPERNPMQWEPGPLGGFTDCRSAGPGTPCPWLPITDNTDVYHVNVQTESGISSSSLAIYKYLAVLRQKPAFMNHNIDFPIEVGDEILSYTRSDGFETYAVVMNLGAVTKSINLRGQFSSGSVVLTTRPRPSADVDISRIVLEKGVALVILLH